MADNPSKSVKTSKLKARLPRGLADRGPSEIAATRRNARTIPRPIGQIARPQPLWHPASRAGNIEGRDLSR